MSAFLLVVALLTLVVPLQAESERSVAPYLSLAPERARSYRIRPDDVVEKENLERTGSDDWLESARGIETSVIRFDSEDGYLMRSRTTPEGTFEYERPVVVLPASLKAGEVHESQRRFVWTVSGEKKDVGAHYFEAELIDVEDVTTAAGTFPSCLRIRRHETRMDYAKTTYVYDGVDWYAEGVGLVKREGKHVWKDESGEITASHDATIELESRR